MSRIVPALTDGRPDPAAIAEAAAALRQGRLVAFPTETVYGLGADARNAAAVARIYELKGRPRGHPLIVHLPGAAALRQWAQEPPTVAEALAERFWPGPLTLVLQRAPGVPDAVTGGQPTVALRVPAHPVALALLRAFGGGVAAPSANLFGRISPTTAGHVAAEFGTPLLVLDGGSSRVGLESTILDLTTVVAGGAPRLLRPGGVPVGQLEEFLGQRVDLPAAGVATPRASGSLPSHYAAKAPSRLVPGAQLPALALSTPGAAVLALVPPPAGFAGQWLTLPADPVQFGRGLYAALRQLDAGQPAVILIQQAPGGAAWLAVRDRLSRATA